MKLNRLLLAIVLVAAISGCATAPTAPTQDAAVSGNPDFSPVTKAVDTNGDGKMSAEEWFSKGLPESSFNMFENGRGYVTQQDYDENAAPAGIDINGDGKLTVEEFIEFDKAGVPGGGAPEGGAPPAGPGGGGQ